MPTLMFDPEGMHRAVLNVVTNALDAVRSGAAGGRVERAAPRYLRRRSAWCRIDGRGQRRRHSRRADGKRSSTPSSRPRKSRGTGLGLPVSQKILNEHGGRILVDSQPGTGRRFTLELPAVLAPATAETVVGPPEAAK